jgi:hypothetical protein
MAAQSGLKGGGTLGPAWTLTAPEGLWRRLHAHLFPGDGNEHGAVILAGETHNPTGLRLLAREVILARDGVDYVTGKRGHRALHPLFIASVARRARDEGLAYLAVHGHEGTDRVAFSAVDLASHKRGYPALLQLTGHPVGGLVVASNAVAGDLWLPHGPRSVLSATTVVGTNITTLTPGPQSALDGSGGALYDRQARMFGAHGQRRLASMRVAVVGLGGAGSIAAEMLARLGIGRLILIDPDRIEPSNLSRIIGSRRRDTRPWMTSEHSPAWLQRLGRQRRTAKVAIAARAIRAANLPVEVQAMPIDVTEPAAARALTTCDWIVLAADSQQARHVVNALVHAYLIPAIQVGVKITVDPDTGRVGNVFAVARRILPESGCLWCNGLIDPTALQLEALGDEGARARAYVGTDAPAPSVITLNGLAVSNAMTDLLLASTELLIPSDQTPPPPGYIRDVPRTARRYCDEPRRDPECRYCGDVLDSLRARGDDATLPCVWGSFATQASLHPRAPSQAREYRTSE